MIQPFDYYEKNNLVEKTVLNISLAKSLIEKAETRLKRVLKEKITEDEASLIFEDVYEPIREASQSLMQLAKYKPLSHEAIIAFLLKNKYLSEENINILNNYRILRNKSVYQAEKISLDKCNEAIKFAKLTLPEIKRKFEDIKKMIPFNDWKKIDLRVGKILEVQDHPNADKLLVMKVDIGNETRTIIAGIRNYYKKTALKGKKVVVFTNLEQKELRGIKSEGMILAAVKDDKVVLISPEDDIDIGAIIQ